MNRADIDNLIAKAKGKVSVQGIASSTRINVANQDLSGIDLSGLNLSGSNFFNANLKGADLRGTTLDFVNLSKAILDGVLTDDDTSFNDANLSKASFTGCPANLLEEADAFEDRRGVKAAIVAQASDKAKAASDWDKIPLEKKYKECVTVMLDNEKYVVGKRMRGANVTGLVM